MGSQRHFPRCFVSMQPGTSSFLREVIELIWQATYRLMIQNTFQDLLLASSRGRKLIRPQPRFFSVPKPQVFQKLPCGMQGWLRPCLCTDTMKRQSITFFCRWIMELSRRWWRTWVQPIPLRQAPDVRRVLLRADIRMYVRLVRGRDRHWQR